MKKQVIALAIAMTALCICTISFAITHKIKHVSEPQTYVTSGWYYTCGEVITEDGNIWGYQTNTINSDDQPVYVLMTDAGTAENIYDDEIVGLIAR